MNPFKSNLSLTIKPKLFFKQTCRGSNEMPQIEGIRNNIHKDF